MRARVAAAALALLCAAPAFGQAVTPASRRDGQGEKARDFTLLTQDGKVFTLSKDAHGRPVLLTFIFTSCPGACPWVIQQCLEAARTVGHGKPEKDRPLVVGVSFDPEVDTPKRLKEHMKENGLKPGDVVFLTGGKDAIDKTIRDWEVNVGRDEKGEVFHSFQTAVIDRGGTIVARWYGSALDVPRLTDDARAAAR